MVISIISCTHFSQLVYIFITEYLMKLVSEKKNISITDLEAREHVYGMPYSEWKEKYQK